jgi:serine/threonine-protein kinase RsbT
MSGMQCGEIAIATEGDIVMARKIMREVSSGMGFGLTDVTRIITAVSELTRNIYKYAGVGSIRWQEYCSGEKRGLRIEALDRGPGIASIDQAMKEGYSTSGGLGMGLPGVRRLMDEMEVASSPSEGTAVTIIKWLRHLS